MKKFAKRMEDLMARVALADYDGYGPLEGELSVPLTVLDKNFIARPVVPHAEPGELQAIKAAVKGHGEQTVLPDDCQFGDNELCFVEA